MGRVELQYQKAFTQVKAYAIFKTKNHVANINFKTTAKGVTAYVQWLGSAPDSMRPMCRGASKIGGANNKLALLSTAETKSIEHATRNAIKEHETKTFILVDKVDFQGVTFFRVLSNYRNEPFDKIGHWHERLETAGFTWIRAL
jgi:hypothetical protein